MTDRSAITKEYLLISVKLSIRYFLEVAYDDKKINEKEAVEALKVIAFGAGLCAHACLPGQVRTLTKKEKAKFIRQFFLGLGDDSLTVLIRDIAHKEIIGENSLQQFIELLDLAHEDETIH